MKTNCIHHIGISPFTMMGPIELRQPLPSMAIRNADPFLLLHHYGPYPISKVHNPFDLGPHPHRGFEPITFIIQGRQRHRDSLGNIAEIENGGVQWVTAGSGILHAEGPAPSFVEEGGNLEGIQLWLNLPAAKKMMKPNYQQANIDQMEKLVFEGGVLTVVAGEQEDKKGVIETQTPVNAFWLDIKANHSYFVKIPASHQALAYLIRGSVLVNNEHELAEEKNAIITFLQDGDGYSISALQDAKLLLLSGIPIDEPVFMEGPFVMNSRKQVIQAVNDFYNGFMGYLE